MSNVTLKERANTTASLLHHSLINMLPGFTCAPVAPANQSLPADPRHTLQPRRSHSVESSRAQGSGTQTHSQNVSPSRKDRKQKYNGQFSLSALSYTLAFSAALANSSQKELITLTKGKVSLRSKPCLVSIG